MNTFSSDQISRYCSLVIDPSISTKDYMPLDLSVHNTAIAQVNASSSEDWEKYIDGLLQQANKQVAYGGYLEKRNLYQRSTYFKNSSQDRNIHLGVDFWIAAGTSVHALTEGIVHSFQDNKNYGDYGPTIILEHELQEHRFYSLYGHLSRESLTKIAVGDKVGTGDQIASLGTSDVNGDYAPHLHFQLILDLDGKQGDYPGVCNEEEVSRYASNCPNPLPVLDL